MRLLPPVLLCLAAAPLAAQTPMATLEQELVARHGEASRARIQRGLRQCAALWRQEDGDLAAFARAHFIADPAELEECFARLEALMESLDGHVHEIGRDFRRQSDLDLGPIRPYDEILAGFDAGAHLSDDFFANKLAFVVLLNFRQTDLAARLKEGPGWTRRQWAEARLVERFSRRVPAEVNQAVAEAAAEADRYVAGYNLWMHHVLSPEGKRLFPAKLRLLSHWNLRDEIKAEYSEGEAGLPKQRTIQRALERIVDQSLPAVVVDSPWVDWNPFTNEVAPAASADGDGKAPERLNLSPAPEPDRRYEVLLRDFRAVKRIDPHSPTAPTHVARRFEEDRQLPEPRVRAMLEAVLGSPLVPRVAKLIEARLGRKLEPFDIWYNGFRPRGAISEAQLDALTRKRFPTPEAYKAQIPALLEGLGFTPERAAFFASKIDVDPARGSGHAMGAQRRADNAHLRTRVGREGMDYKGFNIAVHEMGHNVEQVCSLNLNDHTLLSGVPNTAFTEALAFVFQNHDLELLGLARPDAQAKAQKTLNDFWATFEIAGVGLVDMGVWQWMYTHPDATPAQLREATLRIAKDVWNRYYAPVFGQRDCVLLGVYSHMIHSFLYLPDYPLGHLIAFQIEEHLEKGGRLGAEFERMARQGRLTPDLWMVGATGRPVGPEALLEATARALEAAK